MKEELEKGEVSLRISFADHEEHLYARVEVGGTEIILNEDQILDIFELIGQELHERGFFEDEEDAVMEGSQCLH